MRTRITVAALLVLILASCASGPAGTARRDRSTIQRDEIQSTTAPNAYEVIRQLRPDFLRGRGATSLGNAQQDMPVAFVDGVRLGEPQQLTSIPTPIIISIELISASDATTRWGTGYPAGVIEVKTRS